MALLVAAVACGSLLVVGPASAQPPRPVLTVSVAPDRLPADGSTYAALFLRLQYPNGTPISPTSDVKVLLFSSNSSIITVPEEVTIPAGHVAAVAEVTTGQASGDVSITAVSQEYGGTTVPLTTVGPAGTAPPYHLELTVAPSRMARNSRQPGLLTVALMGSNNVPAPAVEDVTVTITASHKQVATPQAQVVIRAGHYSATGEFQVGTTGTSEFTAQANGYQAATAAVTVLPLGGPPTRLAATLMPSTALALNGDAQTVVVYALDDSGIPAVFPCESVHMSLGRRSAGTITAPFAIPEPYTCGRDAMYGVAGFRPGSATVTSPLYAAASGMQPASVDVQVVGSVATKYTPTIVFPTVGPEPIPTNYLVLTLQDTDGNPAPTPAGITFFLSGNGISVPNAVIARPGETSVAVPISATVASGTGRVHVVAPGMPSFDLDVAIASVSAGGASDRLSVSLNVRPAQVLANQTGTVIGSVLLDGLPLPETPVAWVVEGGEVITGDATTGPDGLATAVVRPTGDAPMRVTLTATRAGIGQGTGSLTVPVIPPTLSGPPLPSYEVLGIRVPVTVLLGAVLLLIVGYIGMQTGLWQRLRQRLTIPRRHSGGQPAP